MTAYIRRIEASPDVLHGKARIKGTRIAVYMVLEMLAGGYSIDEVLNEYPQLTQDDVKACLEYAAVTAREEVYPLEAHL